ncbi:MAG: GFA family protein [Proteobacteria bacterium]|nr:GFA family protein [Pseudomonadota bacterium]
MTTKATGQCLCGAVTYEVEIPAKSIYEGLCHCRDCQRYTGTAFSSSMMVPKAGMSLKGELKFYGKETERGSVMERGFCPECGSNVLCRSEAWPDLYVLAAGSLDDPSVYKPKINIFTRSAHAHVFAIGDLSKREDGI